MSEKPIYRLVVCYNGRWGVKWNGKPDYNHMPKQVTRDNQLACNTKSGDGGFVGQTCIESSAPIKIIDTKLINKYINPN